tara:strand:- start:96 stop:374 length:279 start_codon:yes stop_codon:yes gene_type:complete
MVVLVVISLSIKTRSRRASDFAVPTDEGAGAIAAVQRFSGTREFDEDEEEECEEERRAHRVIASSLSSSSSSSSSSSFCQSLNLKQKLITRS